MIWRAIARIGLPPEPIGRALIIAFCLAFLAGALGCESDADACRRMCAPRPAAQAILGMWCSCADVLAADGGRP